MLRFYLLRQNNDNTFRPTQRGQAMADRFQRLVRSLLPANQQFDLTWQTPGDIYVQGYFEASMTATGAPPEGESWQHEFALSLANAIQYGRTVALTLVDADHQVFVGSFRPDPPPIPDPSGLTMTLPPVVGGGAWSRRIGRLDVTDFERLAPRFAASVLIHEITEQSAWQIHGVSHSLSGFRDAHQEAMLAEIELMGGERLEYAERYTPGFDMANLPQSGWQWWIPYRETGGEILASILAGQGSDIKQSRLERFPNLATFHAAAAAAGAILQGSAPKSSNPSGPSVPPPTAPGAREHTVAPGDTLWAIARRYYGDGRAWPRIHSANLTTLGGNPNLIHPGQRLTIP